MEEALKQLFKAVPDVECKGLCAKVCGPIAMSAAEEALILAKHGVVPEVSPVDHACSALRDGRCSIYEDRPLVCRVYGAVRELRCPYGCAPKGGLLPSREARKLLKRAEAIRVTQMPVQGDVQRKADIGSVVKAVAMRDTQ